MGYASSVLFDKADPLNPVNRRIDIVVLTKKAQRAIEGEQGADAAKAETPTTPIDPTALPADQQPPAMHEEREKLNLFDDKAPVEAPKP